MYKNAAYNENFIKYLKDKNKNEIEKEEKVFQNIIFKYNCIGYMIPGTFLKLSKNLGYFDGNECFEIIGLAYQNKNSLSYKDMFLWVKNKNGEIFSHDLIFDKIFVDALYKIIFGNKEY